MSSIFDLPSDVLKIICCRYESIMLAQCGSKRLSAKLANGGVTHVRLVDYHSAPRSRFPSCLSLFLKLEYLSINRGKTQIDTLKNVIKVLQSLPPTLRKLRLTFVDSEICFLDPGLSESRSSSNPTCRLWDIKSYFPNLQILHLCDPRLSHTSWTFADLAALPASLTHLNLASREPFLMVEPYRHLPSNILTLNSGSVNRIPLFVPQPDVCLALPRTLTSFCSNLEPMHIEVLSSLPSSLTSLSMRLSIVSPLPDLNRFELLDLSIGYVKDMSEMQLKQYDEDWLRSLPRTLTSLSLPGGTSTIFSDTSLRLEHMKWLPRGLKKLNVSKIVLGDSFAALETARESFPRLRRLIIQKSIPTSLIRYLPDTIETLEVDRLRVDMSEPTMDLKFPSAMTNLKVWIPASDEPISCLPPFLTQLSLGSDSTSPPSTMPRYITSLTLRNVQLNEDACANLPCMLVALVLDSFVPSEGMYHNHDPNRPPIITKDVWDNIQESDPDWDHSLYETAHYDLEGCIFNSETQKYEKIDDDDLYGETPVRNLNQSFTSSSANDVHTVLTTSRVLPKRIERHVSVSRLPSTLTSLQLGRRKRYSSSLVSSLPRGLKSLEMSLVLVGHPGAAIDLPRGLTRLSAVDIGEVNNFDLDALPKTLTALSIYNLNRSKLIRPFESFLPPRLDPAQSTWEQLGIPSPAQTSRRT